MREMKNIDLLEINGGYGAGEKVGEWLAETANWIESLFTVDNVTKERTSRPHDKSGF